MFGSTPLNKAEEYDFLPKGAANFAIDPVDEPSDYLFVLLPKLTMLALSAAIEPLRIANQITGQRLYRWHTATHDGQAVHCSNGVQIMPDMALPDSLRNTYTFICSGVEPNTVGNETYLNWIRKQDRFGAKFGGICTGAFQLAKAGVIRGREFTLHWENQTAFNEIYPSQTPSQNLFEFDRGLFTCGGGVAATDMMLRIIASDHGHNLSTVVADMCIHQRSTGRNSVQTSASAAIVGSRNQHLLSAISLMKSNIEEPISMDELAEGSGCSKRQLERLFRKYANETPNGFYTDLRLNHAHSLLTETDLTVTEVAAACGFNYSVLSRRFNKKFGVSPHKFKRL